VSLVCDGRRRFKSAAKPSRDLEGAVLELRFKNRHEFSLPVDNVSNRRSDVVPFPQPARASMPRPPSSSDLFATGMVQSFARIGFEGIHDFFRACFSLRNSVNTSASHMRGQERPLAMRANLSNRREYRETACRVQQVGRLVHRIAFARRARIVRLNRAMSGDIMVPIHGTALVAMEMRAIAGERDQVRHVSSFYTAPSRSRLGKARSRFGKARSRLDNSDQDAFR